MNGAVIVGVLACVLYVLTTYTVPTGIVHSSGAILITGSSSGIGRHAALELARRGYTVFAGVRKQKDVDSLNSEGLDKVRPIIMDVVKDEQVEAAAATIAEWSGLGARDPIENLDMAAIRKMYDVNVLAVLAVTKTFLPLIRKYQGRIVNIGSIAGFIAHAGNGPYAGTKFALEGITDALRQELHDHGVRVSIVRPGYVRTDIFEKGQDHFEQMQSRATPAVREAYPWYFKNTLQKREKSFKTAPGPETTTTPAIVDALTSARPQLRYTVAGGGGYPGWFLTWLTWLLPDVIEDIVVRMNTM